MTYLNGELDDDAVEILSICTLDTMKSEVNNPIDGLSVS